MVAARSHLRAGGANEYLDPKGMFKTTLTTSSGATKETWVYVVAGAWPELVLGDHNAEDLGVNERPPCTGSQAGAGRTGRKWTGTEDQSSQTRSGR